MSFMRTIGRLPRKQVLAGMCLAMLPVAMNSARAELRAYVTNSGSNDVSVVDLASGAVIQTIAVGTAPVGIDADAANRRLYVANSGSASVSRIDAVTGAVDTLTLPGSLPGPLPEGVAVKPDGSMILVTSLESVPDGTGTSGRVYAIDGASFTLLDDVLVEDDPEGIHIFPDGDTAWTASDLKVQEIVIDPLDPLFLSVSDVIVGAEGLDDFEEVAVRSDKAVLFATNDLQGRIDVADLSTETVIDNTPTGLAPEAVVLRPGGAEIHVTNQDGNSVTIISASTFAALDTINLSQNEPRGLAFTPDGDDAWVAMAMSHTLLRYSAVTRTEVGSPIPVGTSPEEVVIFDFVPPANAADAAWRAYE